jgi:uncharacterized protein YejL (UPF0352 family)
MVGESKKLDALGFLMDKYGGREKFVQAANEIALRKGIAAEFWKFPQPGEPTKTITFLSMPEGVVSDKFKKSGGVGLVGTIEDGEGKCPIGLTDKQLMDIVGELIAHFNKHGWTVDLGLSILVGLSFEVSNRSYEDKTSKEMRKKVSFTLLINEAYNRAIVNIQKQAEEYAKNTGTGIDITADMFGFKPEKKAETVPTATPPVAQ